MNEAEEFEFQHQLEKERKVAEGKGAATGRTDTGRSAPDVKIQSATDILKDVATGGLKAATNIGTRAVDAATTVPNLWADVVGKVAPSVADPVHRGVEAVRKAGEEGRQFWQDRYEAAGPAAGLGAFGVDAIGPGGLIKPASGAVRAMLPKVLGETGKRAVTRASLTGAASGAAGGALTTDQGDDPTSAAGVGATIGAAIPPVLHKVIKGINKSAAGEALLKEGIPLTVGDAATRGGGGTAVTAAESAGKYLPFAGNAIENRQQEAVQAWRQAALRRGDIPDMPGAPGAPTPSAKNTTVLDAIRQQQGEISRREAAAVANSKYAPDRELEEALLKITSDPNRLLDAKGKAELRQAYDKLLVQRIRNQAPGTQVAGPNSPQMPGVPAHWTGEDVRQAQQVLARQGRRLRGGQDEFRQATGQGMEDLSREVLELINRQNPTAGATLRNLQAPQQALDVVRKTAEKAPGHGIFSPEDLTRHANQAGHTDLETLGRHGAEAFRGTNTKLRQGTDFRSLGSAAATLLHLWEPTTAALTLGPAMAYRPGAQKMLLGQTKTQKALADYLRKIGATDILGE